MSCDVLSSYAFDHQIVKKDCEVAAKDEGGPVMLRYRKNKQSKWRLYHQAPSWKYFDKHLIYVDDKIDPCITYDEDRHTSLDIQEITSIAETVIQERHHSPDLKLKVILNGYIRQDLHKGNEYIIDAVYNNSKIEINERVRLVRPFLPSVKVQPVKDTVTETVNIIVPISNVNAKSVRYIHLYLKKTVKQKQSTHLLLVVYKKLDFETIQQKVSSLLLKNRNTHITVVRGKGRFSRSKALHQGMISLRSSDLVFFCDVDMVVDPSFYDRCRRNTVRGQQVYFPTVVKLYNPKFIKTIKSSSLPLNRQTGHWAAYGFGMLCIYKSDYIHVGGLNIRMRGWGGEDVDFYHRVRRKGLQLFRAPDKGLVHHWHERDCGPRYVRRSMHLQCVSSKIEALGDKRTLARFIFNITETYPFLLQKELL